MQSSSSINSQSDLSWITFELPDDTKWKCSRTTLEKVAVLGSSFFSMILNLVNEYEKKNFQLEVLPKPFNEWILPYIYHGVLPDESSFKNDHEKNCALATARFLCLEEIVTHLDPPLPPIPEGAIGPEVWDLLENGDVGEVPPVPGHLLENYDDSKMLVLIPKSVGGKPFCANLLKEILQHTKEEKGGYAAKIRTPNSQYFTQYGEKAVEESYWVLMPKDILPGSRSQTRDAQIKLATEQKPEGCQAPMTLEAATSILLWYVKTGERLYKRDEGNELWTSNSR